MKLHSKMVAIAVLLYSPFAWSQCSYGVNTGGGNCVPPDAPGMPLNDNGTDQRQAAAQPAPKWADQWGAIVMDQQSGDYGTVTDRMTKAEAVSDATRDCETKGSSQCKLVVAYYNQCAALVWGVGTTSYAHGETEKYAQDRAMHSCSAGGLSCKIIYSGCSTARRVN